MKSIFNLLSLSVVLLAIILGCNLNASAPKAEQPIEKGISSCTQYAYAYCAKAINFIRSFCSLKNHDDDSNRVIYAGLTYKDLQSGAYAARVQEIAQAMERARLNVENSSINSQTH